MDDDSEQTSGVESPFWPDGLFKLLEACTVFLIVLLAVAATIYEIIWICTGGTWSDAHTRFQDALTRFDNHWRLGLALLVPLFYRTIRTFLEQVKEFMGMKRELPGTQSAEEQRP